MSLLVIYLFGKSKTKRTRRKEADLLIFDLSSFMESFPSDKQALGFLFQMLLNYTYIHPIYRNLVTENTAK